MKTRRTPVLFIQRSRRYHATAIVAALWSLLICLALATPGAAQGTVGVAVDDLDLNEFPDARALVTVRDENGLPITGLAAASFEIVEDGIASFPPSEVTTQVNPEAAVSVIMVIDVSGSMKGKPVQEAIRAANALIDQLSPDDRAAVIAFADQVDLNPASLAEGKELGFTTDKNALRNVVNFLDQKVGWDTPLYDAIYKSVKWVGAEPAGKRAVVLMTDGKDERDNASGVPVKDAGSAVAPDDPINEADQQNIPIFAIGLGDKIDTKYLKRLAERTGGIYQQAPKPEDLTPLFQNVASQLKQQYVLSYDSRLTEDNDYHSLMVRVQLPQGQAFDEMKWQFPGATAPTVAVGEPPATGIVVANLEETPPPATAGIDSTTPEVTPPEPAPAGPGGLLQTVLDTFKENPLLVAVIAAGALLLLLLIIALVIVLLRGRKSEESEYMTAGYEPYGATPDWQASPAGPTPAPGGTAVETDIATGGWSGPGPQPPMPSPVPSPGRAAAAASSPPAASPSGGTVVIERAAKHLALLVDKSHPERRYDLKDTTNIGRARENQIVLEEPSVSRRHAWIKAEGDDYSIFDVGSANGTFVNDEPVKEPRRLENGDIVRFGDAAYIFTRVY